MVYAFVACCFLACSWFRKNWRNLCGMVFVFPCSSFWRPVLSNGPPFFVFQDGISRYSNSKIDFPTWVFLQQKIQCLASVSSCWLNIDHSVVSFLISPSSIFTEVPRVHCQTLVDALSDCCCCGCECCCCECHQLLRVTCGGGRSVECLSNNVRFPF